MDDRGNQVQISIFGQEYSVKAPADPEYIQKIAEYVDSKMREFQSGSSGQGALDCLRSPWAGLLAPAGPWDQGPRPWDQGPKGPRPKGTRAGNHKPGARAQGQGTRAQRPAQGQAPGAGPGDRARDRA